MLRENTHGFSLIELIVIIAIIGIIVMLAAPRFLGYTEKARVARIQNDIKVVEGKVAEEYINSTYRFDGDIDSQVLNDMIGEKTIYGVEGKVNKGEVKSGLYKIVNATQIKEARTKLTGTFYNNAHGKVYYVDDKANVVDNNKKDCMVEVAIPAEIYSVLDEEDWFGGETFVTKAYKMNEKIYLYDFNLDEDGQPWWGLDVDIFMERYDALTDSLYDVIFLEEYGTVWDPGNNITIQSINLCSVDIVEDNLDAKGCPTTGYIPVNITEDMAKSSEFTFSPGPDTEITLDIFEIVKMSQHPFDDEYIIQAVAYKRDNNYYVNVFEKTLHGSTNDFNLRQVFARIEDITELFINSKSITNGNISEPVIPFNISIVEAYSDRENNEYSFGNLQLPEYTATYDNNGYITSCIKNNVNSGGPVGPGDGSSCNIGQYVFEDYTFVDIVSEDIFKLSNGKFLKAHLEIDEEGKTNIKTKIVDDVSEPVTNNNIEHIVTNKDTKVSHLKLEDGKVYTMGDNISGLLGTGSVESVNKYPVTPLLDGVKTLSIAGSGTTGGGAFALKENGDVYVWGANSTIDNSQDMGCQIFGIIGLGDVYSQPTPTKLGVPAVSDILTHQNGAILLTEAGHVYAMGTNREYYLGSGDTDKCKFSGEPRRINELSDIKEIVRVGTGVEEVYYAIGYNGDTFRLGPHSSNPQKMVEKIDKLFTGGPDYNKSHFFILGKAIYNLESHGISIKVNATNIGDLIPVKLYHTKTDVPIMMVLMNDGTIWAWGNNFGGHYLNGLNNSSYYGSHKLFKVGVIERCKID